MGCTVYQYLIGYITAHFSYVFSSQSTEELIISHNMKIVIGLLVSVKIKILVHPLYTSQPLKASHSFILCNQFSEAISFKVVICFASPSIPHQRNMCSHHFLPFINHGVVLLHAAGWPRGPGRLLVAPTVIFLIKLVLLY